MERKNCVHGLAATAWFRCIAVVAVSFLLLPGMVRAAKPSARRVVEHWTPARIANAKARELRIDPRGLAYLENADGTLMPYGHQVSAEDRAAQSPRGKPTGGDSEAPDISGMIPTNGQTTGVTQTFQATITDASPIKSVRFRVGAQEFTPVEGPVGVYSVTLTGFTDGSWSWSVVARDQARNTATSTTVSFTVDTGSGGGGDDPGSGGEGIIANSEWTHGGTVQTAAGRIYFEMPADRRWRRPWVGYVCSGTVVTDKADGRSIIVTAAHCVYDDVYKAFARNVLFIPNQAGTTGAGTDLDCTNDPLGCWTPSFGVVDESWTTRTFPDNIAWDYAFYVVADTGAHEGAGGHASLEAATGSLPISFETPAQTSAGTDGAGDPEYTHALGYSYSDDPNFMYCAENLTIEGSVNWWLPSCELSGGSSGGPWVQPMDETLLGTGPVISVNSWGYTSYPGMAGPMLDASSASLLLDVAETEPFTQVSATDGNAGVIVGQ